MKYLIFIVVLSLVLFLFACKSHKVGVKTVSNIEIPIVTLSKSSCFGKCQVYDLKIFDNKTAHYEGMKNVEKIGLFKSTITENDYQALINLIVASNFENFEATYLTGVSDKQKVTLGYADKQIQYQKRAASEELKAITKKIESIIEKMEWKKS